MNQQPNPPLELWGGVECTFNRVGDRYFNQLEWSGHDGRLDDLDLFAELGLKAMRYPVLWEALAPNHPDEIDWRFADERLNRLRDLDIKPIVGLVHHGSGPRYAHITSNEFAPGLADFARRVAERYPWIESYAPVNEPVTTARFCGLYGLWHPHRRDQFSFVRILLNQCRAICESMSAIREVNRNAELTVTEDLGRIYSTPELAYQAEFENHRRWLGFDLICGRVDHSHIMWQFLMESGANRAELDWFCENPCPPDIVGIDYYPTSDRFLDHRYKNYPCYPHKGNERDQYVDVEAIRVLPKAPNGFKERSCEAWQRYGLPIAITEVHLGCTREEQMRWFDEAWRAAQELQASGVPMRAVTAWGLLGTWNWNSLVTRDEAYYESGVFDVSGLSPRPTALAHMLRDIGNGREHHHPALEHPGWWRRPQRILGAPSDSQMLDFPPSTNYGEERHGETPKALLIIGKDELLGQVFARACDERGLPYYLLSQQEMDMAEFTLDSTNPWLVINVIGENDWPVVLEATCSLRGIHLANFSTDSILNMNWITNALDQLIDEICDARVLTS